jgi:hypothetical protein
MKVSAIGYESKDPDCFNSEKKGSRLLRKVDISTRLHGVTSQKTIQLGHQKEVNGQLQVPAALLHGRLSSVLDKNYVTTR